MLSTETIETIKQDVYEILTPLDTRLLYHDIGHTFNWVYYYAELLAQNERKLLNSETKLNAHDVQYIAIAALFHDVGFTRQYAANEPFAVEILRDYVKTHKLDIPGTELDLMCDAILNTNMQSPPTTIYAMILRDADLSPLGHTDFPTINALLRQEALLYPGTYLHPFAKSNALWKQQQLSFMKTQQWFTRSATRLFKEQKQENVELVKRWRE